MEVELRKISSIVLLLVSGMDSVPIFQKMEISWLSDSYFQKWAFFWQCGTGKNGHKNGHSGIAGDQKGSYFDQKIAIIGILNTIFLENERKIIFFYKR